ncbi:hypothetical protein GCM10010885_21190 [Alicyclobacillus cellulosilyticus]|uniref:histidine kinase n=1 Tax=Alicyclobacillus cellulosilyticus TaxID=1003997 RepID=A0A917KGR3_9BACL|nr:ATP-binding protein [Alicyclobacillus cellulosilyticus]GGJ11679.1 hypothetical protein GCM10010885_21190 [Alicyclobacillus cellulosilyticus]
MSLHEMPYSVGHGMLLPSAWVERINAGVLYLDCNLNVTVHNRLAQQLFVPRVPLWQPVPLQQLLSPDSEGYRVLARLAARPRDVRDLLVLWENEGEIRHVLLDAFAEAGDRHTVPGVWLMTKDLSHFSALEQQVSRSHKLATLSKVAAGVAHEIRNPLTTLKGFLQILAQRLTDARMAAEIEYVRMMLNEIGRVEDMVSELLLLAKPHPVRRVPCALPQLVAELGPAIAELAAEHGVTYSFACDDVPELPLDPALIKHMVMNLVKNAVEAMEHGGELRIHVRNEGAWVVMDVSDTGPGIPFYQMDRIFDAFFTTKEKGTGLGLPVCQRIAGDHGGEVRVSSKGFGTTVSVWLPVQAPAEV